LTAAPLPKRHTAPAVPVRAYLPPPRAALHYSKVVDARGRGVDGAFRHITTTNAKQGDFQMDTGFRGTRSAYGRGVRMFPPVFDILTIHQYRHDLTLPL